MGRVLAPYGVKGWVKVAPFTAAPDALTRFDRWWIGGPDGWEEAEVAEAVRHGANVVARLAGCGDRDQAAKLRGREVALPRESLPEAQKNEYYWADLVGLEVVNAESASFGKVTELFSNGAHDVMRIGAGKGERLVPFVPAVVRKVDLAAGRIEVDWGTDW
jgi:16S rRNA processing protein RimM